MSLLQAGYHKEKMAQRKNSFSEENFMTGFGVGLVAGAIGMFLFGTDEGEKLSKELNGHWQEATKDLLAEGVIENAEQDLWSLFKDILDQASHEIIEHQPSETDQLKASKRASKKRNTFKGV